jgi:hypothetical protein
MAFLKATSPVDCQRGSFLAKIRRRRKENQCRQRGSKDKFRSPYGPAFRRQAEGLR